MKNFINFIIGLLSLYLYFAGIGVAAGYSPISPTVFLNITSCGTAIVGEASSNCILVNRLLLWVYDVVNFFPIFLIICLPIVFVQKMISANHTKRFFLVGFVLAATISVAFYEVINSYILISFIIPVLTFISAYLLAFFLLKTLNKQFKNGRLSAAL